MTLTMLLRRKARTVDQNLKRTDKTRTKKTSTSSSQKVPVLLLAAVSLIWIGLKTNRQHHVTTNSEVEPPNDILIDKAPIIKVACVGDSLTRGDIVVEYGRDDYPTQLQTLLGNTFQVRNFGVRSVTAIGGFNFSYNRTKEYRQSLQFQPDIVLFMLGTNDAKFWEQHGKNRFEHDYSELVTTFQRLSPSPPHVIVAITPWVQKDFRRIKDVTLVQYVNPAIQSVAQLLHTPFADMRAATYGNESLYINDGLHFNAQGYAVLANTWRNIIEVCLNGSCRNS